MGGVEMKTSELTGPALDWAVAQCEGVAVEHINDGINRCLLMSMGGRYTPSTDWSQGGPIVERERISVCTEFATDEWAAWSPAPTLDNAELQRAFGYGPTPLIAAMRCYVASKLGDNVDIPEELL